MLSPPRTRPTPSRTLWAALAFLGAAVLAPRAVLSDPPSAWQLEAGASRACPRVTPRNGLRCAPEEEHCNYYHRTRRISPTGGRALRYCDCESARWSCNEIFSTPAGH